MKNESYLFGNCVCRWSGYLSCTWSSSYSIHKRIGYSGATACFTAYSPIRAAFFVSTTYRMPSWTASFKGKEGILFASFPVSDRVFMTRSQWLSLGRGVAPSTPRNAFFLRRDFADTTLLLHLNDATICDTLEMIRWKSIKWNQT